MSGFYITLTGLAILFTSKNPGGVNITVNKVESVAAIFKAKASLRKNEKYKNVFIENDLSLEQRVAKSNLHTMLKATGKDKEFVIRGLRLVKKT